jgi:CBS domain-containing protein
MSIAEILEGKGGAVVSIEAETPVREAVALIAAHRIGALPVIENGRVVGIISERDVIYCLATEAAAVLDFPVSRVMTAPAVTVEPRVSVLAALSDMSKRRIRHLPVVESDRLIGIVSIGDLVAYRIRKIEEEAKAMRIYIQSA